MATMRAVSALLCHCLRFSTESAAAATPPHIVHFVADDLGFDDLGHNSVLGNGGKTHTPAINRLIDTGIAMREYYTFKVCSPSRASILTGRYPWRAGFYDMSDDENHCTSDFELLPAALKRTAGYVTHALGKWGIGNVVKKCTATFSGFDTFLGYYGACTSDYWYHWSATQCDHKGPYVDLANSTSGVADVSDLAVNGTYNAQLFAAEAVKLIEAHDQAKPMFLYLAPQNVHLACAGEPGNVAVETAKRFGLQAPCATVDFYGAFSSDAVKVQGAMITELDYVVGNVTAALQRVGMWENTVFVLVSDNGAPLHHGFNAPLRGGKHTFWEGGVRVVSFVSSPLLPMNVRGTHFNGMAHSSDWYSTYIEGLAGGKLLENSGPGPVDGFNLWPSLVNGTASPRTEVVHALSSWYYDATVGKTYDAHGNVLYRGNCDDSCARSIRQGKWKLILGNAGDDRILAWPKVSLETTPFGRNGGYREHGTDHCRAKPGKSGKGTPDIRLFNLDIDISESNNLAYRRKHAGLIKRLVARLDTLGAEGPPAAYVFEKKAARKKAKDDMCQIMEKTKFQQPSDVTPMTIINV